MTMNRKRILSVLASLTILMTTTACFFHDDGGDTTGPAPRPGVAVYETCFTVDDCVAAADDCYALEVGAASNAICSYECAIDDDCVISSGSGRPGVCEALDPAAPAICYESCIDDGDCLTGFRCTDLALDGDVFLCLPG